jgi:hypothetical protein
MVLLSSQGLHAFRIGDPPATVNGTWQQNPNDATAAWSFAVESV